MNEMTLPSGNRIRNSSPGGMRPSMLSLGHNIESLQVSGEETFCFFETFKLEGQSGV